MSTIPLAKTTIEIFCREDAGRDAFHIVFSRTGLPWILDSVPGLSVEKVPCEIVDDTVHCSSRVTVPTFAEARLIVRDFLFSGWHLEFAIVQGQTLEDFSELAYKLR